MKKKELFQVFNNQNVPFSPPRLLMRDDVHRSGAFHRSSHVLVFKPHRSAFLVQLRSPSKDICPDHWDISCAEHVKPFESYVRAAVRGIKEELNLIIDVSRLYEWRSVELFQVIDEAKQIRDCEFNSSYLLELTDDEVQRLKIDNDEVVDMKWIDEEELEQWLVASQSDDGRSLTPWMMKELALFKEQEKEEEKEENRN